MSGVNDGDPDHTKRIASAYDQIVKSCSEEPLQSALTRITEEIIDNLNRKLAEMKPLLVDVVSLSHVQDAIETRKKCKMDYDHYYFKLEQMRNKPNTDPSKVIRVGGLDSDLCVESRQIPGMSDSTYQHHRSFD